MPVRQFLSRHMLLLAREDRPQIVQCVAVPQPVEADVVAPALRAGGDGFAAPVDGAGAAPQNCGISGRTPA